MAFPGTYSCSRCGQVKAREELLVKNVRFMQLGRGGSIIKSRSPEWLCETCVEKDAVWQLPQHYSPGTGSYAETPVERRNLKRPLDEVERLKLKKLQERMAEDDHKIALKAMFASNEFVAAKGTSTEN